MRAADGGNHKMAININIDNQLGLVYSFRIAGKKRELTFSDDCALEMEKVNLKVDKSINKIDNIDDEKLEGESVEKQLELVQEFYKDIRDSIIPFFDKYFGEKSGEEIYQYVHESTRALAVIFNKIYYYLDEVEIKDDKSKEYKK